MRRLKFDATAFADPRLEWRRLFGEAFGTFFLVVVAGVVNAVSSGEIGRVAAVVAPSVMVMAIIVFMGAISGAHLNPAMTIGFAARGDFLWKRVPGYVAAQLLGATAVCLFLRLMFGNVGMLGATEPAPGISDLQAMLPELLLTLGLVSTIPGDGIEIAERGSGVRAGRRRLHRVCPAVGEPDERRVDKSGSIVRAGSHARDFRLGTPR